MGRSFADAHPGNSAWSFKFDATGLWIGTLHIDDLWSQLVIAEGAVLAYEGEQLDAVGMERAAPDSTLRELPQPSASALAFAALTQNLTIK